MENKYKSKKLQDQYEHEQSRYDSELHSWKTKISRALLEYFDYKKELVLVKHIEEREREAKKKQQKEKGEKKKEEEKPKKEAKKPDV